jgi:hypothetical protein
MGDRRYPLADLLALLRGADGGRLSDDQARRTLNVSGAAWRRHHADGLAVDQAERLATRAGRHPSEVWPTWVDDELAELGRRCAECGETFIPWRKDQRFCPAPARCRVRWHNRATKRRRYARNPERFRAARRSYYAECRDYEVAARRRRYWQDPEAERERKRRARAAA